MRAYLIFIFAFLLFSCGLNKKFKTMKYPTSDAPHKLIVKLPKGYAAAQSLQQGIFQVFKYKDSSIVYITDVNVGGLNYNNIEDTGKLDSLFYVKYKKGILLQKGVDKNGCYWANYFYKEYSVGYKNVPKMRKEEFDKLISDIHVN